MDQLYYHVYRLEHGLSRAEQRAADQCIGELAASLAGTRRAVAFSLCRVLGALKSLARGKRTRKEASVVAAPAGR